MSEVPLQGSDQPGRPGPLVALWGVAVSYEQGNHVWGIRMQGAWVTPAESPGCTFSSTDYGTDSPYLKDIMYKATGLE